MYTEIIFKHRDPHRIYPDLARKIVALACDGLDMDPAFFNRGPDGKTLSGTYGQGPDTGFGIPPRITFDGGPGFIRIYGVGELGSEILGREALKAFPGLYKMGYIGFEQKSGEMEIEYQPFDSLYVVRSMVVARSPAASQKFIKSSLTGEVAQAAQEVVLRGMTGVAKLLDDERLNAGLAMKFEQAIPRVVTFIEGKPLPVPIKEGVLAAGYKDILLSMPCKLNGPWSTGILRSRGYGLIRRFNPTKDAA